MAKTVSVIGIDPGELPWLRLLLQLLRHPDPNMAELVGEALLYLAEGVQLPADPLAPVRVGAKPLDYAG